MDNFRKIQRLLDDNRKYSKSPESFKSIRKETNPLWEGWKRVDLLKSKATPLDAIANDGKLVSSASSYQFDLYTKLGLGGKPFELELAIMSTALNYGFPLTERILKDMTGNGESVKEFWLLFYTKMKNVVEPHTLLDMIPLEVTHYVG